jgi:hypothetical protein
MFIDTSSDTTSPNSPQGRRHDRVSVEMVVRLRKGVERSTVFLKDMTTHGARVEGLGRMQIDESVTVSLPGLKPKTAFVAWCDAHSAGLEFEKPLCRDVFRELVIMHARREGSSPTDALRRAA